MQRTKKRSNIDTKPIVNQLGKGGFGAVYQVEEQDGSHVAIKTFNRASSDWNTSFKESFEEEFRYSS